MLKLALSTVPVIALLLSVLVVAGCGANASGDGANTVVARVGSSEITSSTLNHWIATFVRGDYFSSQNRKAPAKLSTNPPNYTTCAEGAQSIVAHSPSGRPKFTISQLELKCRQLYQAVKLDALTYLISALWAVGEGRERGQIVTDAEVKREVKEYGAAEYPKKGQFQTYLTNKGWSLGDIRYILKRNMLARGFLKEVQAEAAKAGGGQQALGNTVSEHTKTWTAKTSCRPGYIVWECKEYTPAAAPPGPSPAVLFEQIIGG